MTRLPIPIENFIKKEADSTSGNPQTFYIQQIEDGSDDLLPVTFYPEVGASGVPTNVTVNIFYY